MSTEAQTHTGFTLERTKLQTVLDRVPAGIFIVEAPSGKIIFANNRINEIVGQPLLPLKDIRDLLNVHSWRGDGQPFTANDMPIVRSLRDGETINGEELHFNRPDGSQCFVVINSAPICNTQGRIIAAVGTFHDITEKKRTETELRKHRRNLETLVSERTIELKMANERLEREIAQRTQAQERLIEQSAILEAFIKHAPFALVLLDKNFNFIKVNEEYAKACQRDIDSFNDQNHFELYPHKENEAIFRKVVATKTAFHAIAKPFIFPDHPEWGTTYWDWSLVPIPDKNGEVELLVFALKDVTERKEMDEKMRRYQRQLRSLASKVSLTEERLRRSIASDLHDGLGQLLAMSKIKLGQLRQSAGQTGLSRPLEEIRKLIEEAIGYTRTLTVELSPPVLHELGLEAGLEWLCEQIQKQHKIQCTLKSSGLTTPLDSEHRIVLFQIIRELLHNIVKHAQAGTASISVDTIGENIRVTVTDDGIGFDVREASSRPEHASCFGLFDVREKLAHLGGSLEVDSVPGRGTYIKLIAPVK